MKRAPEDRGVNPNLYKVMGLEGSTQFDSSDKEIQRQFRLLARPLHPDQVRRRGGDAKQSAILFDQLRVARDTLLDPELRAEHDKKLKVGAASAIRFAKQSEARKRTKTDLEAREKLARAKDADLSTSNQKRSSTAPNARFAGPFDAAQSSAARSGRAWEYAIEESRDDFLAAFTALRVPPAHNRSDASSDSPAAKRPRVDASGVGHRPSEDLQHSGAPGAGSERVSVSLWHLDPDLRGFARAGVPVPVPISAVLSGPGGHHGHRHGRGPEEVDADIRGKGEGLEELLEWAGDMAKARAGYKDEGDANVANTPDGFAASSPLG